MRNGFTLVETMAAMVLLLFAVLSSSRILVASLGMTRHAARRFRMAEALDDARHRLNSLPPTAGELDVGVHRRQDGEFVVSWQVEARGDFLKRVRLEVSAAGASLGLVFHRSRFIQEAVR